LELRHGANLDLRGNRNIITGGSGLLSSSLGRKLEIRAKKRKATHLNSSQELDKLLRSAGFKSRERQNNRERERERESAANNSRNQSELDEEELSKRVFVNELLYSSLFS